MGRRPHGTGSLFVRADNRGRRPGHLLADETDPGKTNPFTTAPLLYALGLLVAEPVLGWSGIGGPIDTVVAALN